MQWYHSKVMRMHSETIRAWRRHIALVASLCLLTPACGEPTANVTAESLGLPQVKRPNAATPGKTRAFLGAAAGTLSITAANGNALENRPGSPLLADDRLVLGDDGLAVVIFTNGNVLRLEGPLDQELRTLAGFDSAPIGDDLETQLVAALSDADRTRLSAENERIGGWQLRLTALEAPAPESEERPLQSRTKDRKEDPPKPIPNDTPISRMDGAPKLRAGGLPTDLRQKESDKTDGTQGQNRPESPTKKTKEKGEDLGGGLPSGVRSGNSPARTGTPTSPAGPIWTLTSAHWTTSGSKIEIPPAISTKIIRCLPTTKGPRKLVTLVLRSGLIREFDVQGKRLCDPEIIGQRIPGTSQSGSLQLSFELTRAP
ncbi:MAG TPA: hypothetical protein ENK31_05510 [Nannocystis exedens]|nr:hypothetical protein [Nannocystis exedens]